MKSTMRAWEITKHGGTDVLEFVERPIPEPGPGQVRIRAVRGALNHLDLWVRRGIPGVKYPLPMIPVSDVAGVVDKLGEGCVNLKEGQRVTLLPGSSCGNCVACNSGDDPMCRKYGIRGESFDGGAAEYIVAPSAEVFPIPDHLSWDIAAAFGLTFLTAYRMVNTRGQVKPSDWVLVHAAGSGVSIAAIQFALLAGSRVIATAGSPEKIEKAAIFGLEKIINYKESDFAVEVREITGKRGVDLIIDHVGKDTFPGNINSLARGGRLVICGTTSGPIVETNLAMVFFKGLSILGSTMGSRYEYAQCLDLVSRGLVKPIVDRVYKFDEYPKAQEYLESRMAFGKVLIEIS
ncbi:MAG: zinc-binding dehydrogenase [bacterium]|nr:zinc-binding dehydrogenase [bacterium]